MHAPTCKYTYPHARTLTYTHTHTYHMPSRHSHIHTHAHRHTPGRGAHRHHTHALTCIDTHWHTLSGPPSLLLAGTQVPVLSDPCRARALSKAFLCVIFCSFLWLRSAGHGFAFLPAWMSNQPQVKVAEPGGGPRPLTPSRGPHHSRRCIAVSHPSLCLLQGSPGTGRVCPCVKDGKLGPGRVAQ